MDLFSLKNTIFKLPNAELIYVPDFINPELATYYFKTFRAQIDWQQDDITVFGKTYRQPRLTALYAENELPYRYSNITMIPKKMTPELLDIKSRVEANANHQFTTVLLNLYRSGNDSNGWHADNEKELGKHPIIASVSLGQPRAFQLKHRYIKEEKHKLILEHGSLLIMKGEMQEFWLHQIAKTKLEIKERINLTFRTIKEKVEIPQSRLS